MGYYCVCALVLLVAATAISSQRCTTTNDCECGDMCVGRSRTLPCPDDERCRCRKGCGVGSVYIRPGRAVTAYCNICRCDLQIATGKPFCSRRGWCDLPENVTLYQDNDNCP